MPFDGKNEECYNMHQLLDIGFSCAPHEYLNIRKETIISDPFAVSAVRRLIIHTREEMPCKRIR